MITLLALFLYAASPGQQAYEKANQLLVAQRIPEAFAAVDEALRLDPKLVPALTLKAKLAMATYRLDIAHECLEKALAIEPRAPYANFLYGLEAYLGNDLQAALPRFKKARQLNPKDARAALYLGLTVESLGDTTQALALYQESVRLDRTAESLLPGARLLHLLGRFDESEKWLRQAAQLAPKSRDVHFELARLLLKKGDPAQAAQEGETALQLSEGVVTDPAIHYLLIRAYRESNQPEKATLHAETIKAQDTTASQKQ